MRVRKKRKDPAAVALGKKGGRKRVKNQTAEERSESARAASNARWAKYYRLKLVAEEFGSAR